MADIHVVIADDHPLVLRGIAEILRTAEGIEVVGQAGSGEETLRLVEVCHPEVLVLDMELPDMTGVEVMKSLVERKSPVITLGLSSYDDREYIRELLMLGAAGYLIKDEAADWIVDAVRGVASGQKGWVSRRVAVKMGDLMIGENENPLKLTSRELEVLRCIIEGKTNGEIAAGIHISEKTVEKYVSGIFAKLHVTSRLNAAVLALRKELV